MSQPPDGSNDLPPEGSVNVDNFSKTYERGERFHHRREHVDEEIAKELFKGNMKNMKHVTSETTVTTFDAIDSTGKKTKISAVDIKYQLGSNTVVIKAGGEMYTGSEAQMRYNMIPGMKITGQGYDKKYEAPKVIPTHEFSYFPDTGTGDKS